MKRSKSRQYSTHKKDLSYTHLFTGFLAVSMGLVGVLTVAGITLSTVQSTRVLGDRVLLADHGSDSGSGDNSGPSTNTSSGDSQSGSQTSQVSETSQTSQQAPAQFSTDESGPGRFQGSDERPRMNRVVVGSGEGRFKEFHPEDIEMPEGSDEGEMPEVEHHSDGDLLRVGSISARSHFPIMITASGAAVVVTPHGTIVAVLPDKALEALLKNHVLQHIDEGSTSATLTDSANGPVYEIHGSAEQKLLGLIPVQIHKTVEVSAITGQTVAENETLGSRILDLFSF